MKKNIDEIVKGGIDQLIGETYRTSADGPWYKIGEKLGDKDLSSEDRKALLQNSRDRYWKTPEGRSLIESTRYYVIGQGIIYHAEDENPIVQEKLDEFWNHPENIMELRQKEIVIRALRDGEVFIRLFPNPITGLTLLRFIEPGQIDKIEYDPDDAEKPLNYIRKWTPANATTEETETIPAESIIHIKLNADMDMARGRPHLEPIIKRLIQLEQFIEGRVVKNRIGAGFMLEKIIHGKGGTAEAVSSTRDGMSDASTESGVSTASKKMPKFGSVIVHNDAIEYKWCNPEIKADDCSEDARLIKLSICAGVNAPEYLLSDASNANYSSSMVAENPFVRKCEDLQDTFKEYFKIMFRKVIENLINAGIIPKTSTQTIISESRKGMFNKIKRMIIKEQNQKQPIPTKTLVKIEFPPMTHKEIKTESEAYQIQSAMGWASDKTLSGKLGYDWDKEREEMERLRVEREAIEQPEKDFEKEREEEIEKSEEE